GCDFKMYIAKVLVGESTIGKDGMKAPPSRNDRNNPGLQFDSLVDKINDPSIFVIFQDNQHYPEYLVSFKQRK
ncbi:poly [ADP-ribose] polymerase 14-like, partial [Paramuricea clavata]